MNSSNNNKNPYFLPIGNSGMMKQWIVNNVDIPAIKHCHTAGVSMNAGTAVYAAADGRVYPYQVSEDDLYIGILESPAYVGKAVTVQYAGYLKLEGSGWQPGLPYYAVNGGGVVASVGGRQVAVGTGTDAIVILSGGGGSGDVEDNRGVYFVDKRYDDEAGALVTGYDVGDITSANATYTTQLSFAKRGSVRNPWPDPWSARNQALTDIADGLIDEATIIVLSGEWLVGSNNYAKNGSVDGTAPNSGVAADILFTLVGGTIAPDTNVSSLLQDKLNFFFHPGTSIVFINSTDAIGFISNAITTGQLTSSFTASLKGHLNFKQVYGLPHVFTLPIAIAQVNSDVELEFNRVELGTPNSYSFIGTSFYKRLHVRIEEVIAYGGGVFIITYGTDQEDADTHNQIADGLSETVIEIGSYKNLASPDPSIVWTTSAGVYSFVGFEDSQPWAGSYLVNINVKNVYVVGGMDRLSNLLSLEEYLPFNSKIEANYENVRVYIDNAFVSLYTPETWEGCLVNTRASCYRGMVNVRFGNVESEFPLLYTTRLSTQNSTGVYGTSSESFFTFKVHSDLFIKKYNTANSTQATNLPLVYLYDENIYTTSASNGMLYVSGNYKSTHEMIQALGTYGGITTYKANFSGMYYINFPANAVLNLDTDRLTNLVSFTDAILRVGSLSSSINLNGIDNFEIFIKNVMMNALPNLPATITYAGETPTYDTEINNYFR